MSGKVSVNEIWANLKSSSAITRKEPEKPPVNFDKIWYGFTNGAASEDDSGQRKQSPASSSAHTNTAIVRQPKAITQDAVGTIDSDVRSSDLEALGHQLQRSIALLKDSAPAVRRQALTDIKVGA